MEDKMRTWSDLCERFSSTPLINSPYSDDEAPYLEEYRNNFDEFTQVLDVECKEKYASLRLIRETDDVSLYNNLIRSCCIRNHYKWLTLWETMSLKYDPVANVEEHTVVTTVYGTHETVEDIGQRNETTVTGERKTNGTEKGNTFPYNDPNQMKQTAQNTFDNTTSAANDSKTTKPTQDTTTSMEHTDTVTTDRKGNIGVKSSQSLVLEQREVALLDFYSVIYEDIVETCTIPVFESEMRGGCFLW